MREMPLLKYCFLALCLAWSTHSQSQPGFVQTPTGPIQGCTINVEGRTVHEYLGMPYAQPPVGNLRFRKPQPIQPWSETFQATKMPPACIQYTERPVPWFDFQPGKSEDCLYLNMWVPKSKSCNSRKAVMFWIHGGSFSYGSGRLPVYDGRVLAALGDVIVVTINYRLAAFGFFTTNTDAAPVNNGLYDMVEALKWVNRNVGAFGGDPNRVTVFGESAGSWATGFICLSPLTKGLFHSVIMESGSPAFLSFYDNTTNVVLSEKLSEALGCADRMTNISTSPDEVAGCMRGKDAFEIAKTANSFNPSTGLLFFPVAGNEILPLNAAQALNSGNFHNVSLLIGNNLNELSIFVPLYFPDFFGYFGKRFPERNISVSENLVKGLVKYLLKDIPDGDRISEIVFRRLSANDHRNNIRIMYDFIGDLYLTCPDEYFAESFSRYSRDVYFYYFKHRSSTTPWAKFMGVAHFEEVQFVFGSPLKEDRYTCEEVELSKRMMKIWSNFAKYGDPFHYESEQSYPGSNGFLQSNLRPNKWPVYTREKPVYYILDTRQTNWFGFGPDKDNCDLLRGINGFQ